MNNRILGLVLQNLASGLLVSGIIAACTGRPGPGVSPANADTGSSGGSGGSGSDGSRLKSRFIAGDDGSRFASDVFDSQLGATCKFVLTEDGSQRCLVGEPAIGVGVRLNPDGSLPAAYKWVPVVKGNSGCPPKYILAKAPGSDGACGNPYSVYEAAPAVDKYCLAVAYNNGNPQDAYCSDEVHIPSDAAPGTAYFLAGAKVDVGTFVKGTPNL